MARDFVPYDFTSGRYRAKLRTTYTDAFLVQKNKESEPYEFDGNIEPPVEKNKWVSKSWSGLNSFFGNNIWSDGNNIYYSYSTSQYVLNDKENGIWRWKDWEGTLPIAALSGNTIWTDGENIYCSYVSSGVNHHAVLNKSTGKWENKIWYGLDNIKFYSEDVWTDGTNIYYSTYDDGGHNLKLNKVTSTWEEVSIQWDYGYGPEEARFYGSNSWIYNGDVYISNAEGTEAYIRNKSTGVFMLKNWDGPNFSYVWNDGDKLYSSYDDEQYYYDDSDDSWKEMTWVGNTPEYGSYIWKDGDHIYYSYNTTHYELVANE